MSDLSVEQPEVDEVPVEKKFTQEDVNRLLSKERKSLDKKLEESRSAWEKELLEIKQQLPATPAVKEDDFRGKLELAQAELAKTKENLTRELESHKREAALEREKRLEGERERALYDALLEAKCLDNKLGKKLFQSNVKWDDDKEAWMFFPDDGTDPVSVQNGVKIHLPPWLKPPEVPTGGGGTPPGRTGSTHKTAKYNELDALRSKRDEAFKNAQTKGSRDPRAISEYQSLKRKVAELEVALASPKTP